MNVLNKLVFIAILLFNLSLTQAQELKCNVQVQPGKAQLQDRQVIEDLRKEIYEFMNTRIWTQNVFTLEERIECNLVINISEQTGADRFTGELQFQVIRPVYNSSYNTVLFNLVDKDIAFRYVSFTKLEFSPTQHLSNLTSLLAYYAYVAIGIDYDSFSPKGGTPFYRKAETIVNNAQNEVEPGWKSFESSRKNRYWLINNLLSEGYSPIRQFYYTYHRLGLDIMSAKPDEARSVIVDAFKYLQTVYRSRPDAYTYLLQVVFDAKTDEFVNVLSEGPTEEHNRAVVMLSEIDAQNANKYKGKER